MYFPKIVRMYPSASLPPTQEDGTDVNQGVKPPAAIYSVLCSGDGTARGWPRSRCCCHQPPHWAKLLATRSVRHQLSFLFCWKYLRHLPIANRLQESAKQEVTHSELSRTLQEQLCGSPPSACPVAEIAPFRKTADKWPRLNPPPKGN